MSLPIILRASFEADTLTLNDVPLVVYFSDRPERIAGHISLDEFVEDWSEGLNNLQADPPNATLSIIEESGTTDVVVELSDPWIYGDVLTFKIRILEGEMPVTFKASSLFVDAAATMITSSSSTSTDAPKVVAEAPAEAMGTVYQT